MFPDQISTWISRLCKEDCFYQYKWASSNLLRASTEQKKWKKDITALFDWAGHIHLLPLNKTPLVFRLSDTELNHGFPGIPPCRNQIVGPLGLLIAWANSYNKSPYIYNLSLHKMPRATIIKFSNFINRSFECAAWRNVGSKYRLALLEFLERCIIHPHTSIFLYFLLYSPNFSAKYL